MRPFVRVAEVLAPCNGHSAELARANLTSSFHVHGCHITRCRLPFKPLSDGFAGQSCRYLVFDVRSSGSAVLVIVEAMHREMDEGKG
jgi:hypothetical protein